jgi:NitT/TauT family transport system ATP-binding protein
MTERIVAAFVPLVDCAVLVAAREQGFAAEEGLDLVLVKEPSWASLRDHLSLGYVDCAHALAPLPVALTLGVGHLQVDCIAPFVLGRGGNAVTVSTRLFAEMQGATSFTNPLETARALAAVARRRVPPLTFGMVFPFSNHNFDLRYWLAAGGLHPDRDVRLVAIPPPLMVDSLRAGLVDGFCVGAPWNSLAVAHGLGAIVVTQSQLFPRAVEKVLALRSAFARHSESVAKSCGRFTRPRRG